MNIIDNAGTRVDLDELIGRYNEGEQRSLQRAYAGSLLGIDMDNTMFDNDLGVLVFLEKLNDPHFWDFDVDEFSKLLMPRRYKHALTQGAEGAHEGKISTEMSQLGLDIHAACLNLYALIQRIVQTKSTQKEMAQRVIREFARKMVEFDQIFIRIDSHLTNLFDMPLLMRTRFFAGKELGDVHKMTLDVMNRNETSVDRIIDLGISPELGKDLEMRVSEEQIAEAHGKESQHKMVDRLVVPVNEVRDIIRKALLEWDKALGIVLTANLHGIGETAVDNSIYDFIRKKQNHKGTVIGSKLIREEGVLKPRLLGEPVLGKQKVEEAMRLAGEMNKHFALAFGDSSTTDGPMMRKALDDGGSAIIVTKDIEEAKRRFYHVLRLYEVSEEISRRIFYLIPQFATPQLAA